MKTLAVAIHFPTQFCTLDAALNIMTMMKEQYGIRFKNVADEELFVASSAGAKFDSEGYPEISGWDAFILLDDTATVKTEAA